MTPLLKRTLKTLGENFKAARLRRWLRQELLAERAGISVSTLRKIERGDPSVSFGLYANVLQSLRLEEDLKEVALKDELGRKLQDAELVEPDEV